MKIALIHATAGAGHFKAAEAVFKTLAYAPSKKIYSRLYECFPFFKKTSEWFYALVAKNRVLFSKMTHFLWGLDLEPPTFQIISWFFIKALALIYFFAFLSFAGQILGLVGSHGIIPANQYLKLAHEYYGWNAFFKLPSLFWINASDIMLMLVTWGGVFISLLLLFGIRPVWCLFSLWLFYFSLINIGQDFTSFQWDSLLLEVGFLSLFYVPWQNKRPGAGINFWNPPAVIRLLLCLVLFRLVYFSGMVKLRSGDLTWRNLTALTYHYETQPLPTCLAWYVHHFPLWFHKLSCLLMFGFEIVVPFFIFMPRRLRLFACTALLIFQMLILLTGNYCFFNLLAISLCLLLIDDKTCGTFLKGFAPRKVSQDSAKTAPKWVIWSVLTLTAVMLSAQVPKVIMNYRGSWLQWFEPVREKIRPFHSFNQYGLFAVMTTQRQEVILEGSHNRVTWQPYEFKYKPGDPLKKPDFNIPFQPRLDWQMWFAVLGTYQESPWMASLCQNLLRGSKPVLKLFKEVPFQNAPPRYLRAVVYNYHFSDPETRKKTGVWWIREKAGLFMPVMTLREKSS